MHVNNPVSTSAIGEDVLWLFGFNRVIGRLLCVQSRRLKANISLPTCKKEISATYEYKLRSVAQRPAR